MAKTVTATAVKRIITKGLTGWQAGKLILQDSIDSFLGKTSVLSESDMTAIQQAPMGSADIRDYNLFMGLYRGFHRGYMLAEWACKDACLQLVFLDHILQDADKRRTVELFESFCPRVVTRKQYEGIVGAQRAKKLEFEYSLGYVIEERFYAIAPPEAGKEIDEARVDVESVTVQAAYSKHRQEDILPLRPETAADLRTFFANKAPDAKAFGGRYRQLTDKTSKMIQADLKEAGIPYVDDAGRYRDFHALRHTTGSWLAANGVHPKVAQAIMRHSDINLTMSRYTHTLKGQEAQAIRSLPDLSTVTGKQQRATGTDEQIADADGRTSAAWTPKWTPDLTPTAYSGCNGLSSIGTVQPRGTERTTNHKGMNSKDLGTRTDRLASTVITGRELRPEGLEPPTIGSEDRWRKFGSA